MFSQSYWMHGVALSWDFKNNIHGQCWVWLEPLVARGPKHPVHSTACAPPAGWLWATCCCPPPASTLAHLQKCCSFQPTWHTTEMLSIATYSRQTCLFVCDFAFLSRYITPVVKRKHAINWAIGTHFMFRLSEVAQLCLVPPNSECI